MVSRIHWRRSPIAVSVRRHRWEVAVVVVPVGIWTVVVADTWRHRNDHPALGTRPVPIEADRLEIFEGGKAVEFIAQFVVGHDGEGVSSVNAVLWDIDGYPLDSPRMHF